MAPYSFAVSAVLKAAHEDAAAAAWGALATATTAAGRDGYEAVLTDARRTVGLPPFRL